jgi:hypothetical protein
MAPPPRRARRGGRPLLIGAAACCSGLRRATATAGRSPRVPLTIEVPVNDMADGDGAVQAETLPQACAKE